MSDFTVPIKAVVGYASDSVEGVRNLEVMPEFEHLPLQSVSFGNETGVQFIEDPDHPGFAKAI